MVHVPIVVFHRRIMNRFHVVCGPGHILRKDICLAEYWEREASVSAMWHGIVCWI